jgi:hypothetical protein
MRMQHDRKFLQRFNRNSTAAWFWLGITTLLIGIFTILGPAESSLGSHIRIVYLHGAWVWASLVAFFAAGICGALGMLTKREHYHHWSEAFGRTGLIFWITYLPLSLLAMQSNWNGLFLAEPRWRLALVFSIAGILLQTGLTLADKPFWTSGLNLGYFTFLVIALAQTPNVMHPASPILDSNAWHIQFYFFSLVLLSLIAVWQMAKWWYKGDPNRIH